MVVTTKIQRRKLITLYFMTENNFKKYIEDHLNYDIADFLLIEKIKKG